MEAVKPKPKVKNPQKSPRAVLVSATTSVEHAPEPVDAAEAVISPLTSPGDEVIQTVETSALEVPSAPPGIGEFDRLLTANKMLLTELSYQEIAQEVKVPTEKKPVTIQAYTETQLAGFYVNPELEAVKGFTEQYIEAELRGVATKQHPLYELLTNYLHVRDKITGNKLELEQYRKEYKDIQDSLWSTHKALVTGKGECLDKNQVTATHSYEKATFHRSHFQRIVRLLALIRKLTYENHNLYIYTAEDLKLQIELYVQTVITNCVNGRHLTKEAPVIVSLTELPQELQPHIHETRLCISVLFAFQRKLIRDETFLGTTRDWLRRLIAVLLRIATYQDHLFVLNHVLRCPPGVGTWGAAFIQAPLAEILPESPFSSHEVNHVLVVLATVLAPVKDREKFLDDLSQKGDSPWIVVDSDGEEDDESGTSLRENDLVAFLNQLPLEELFRLVLLIERRDFEHFYNATQVTTHHILRFIAFGTALLNIIGDGLKTYDTGRYKQFCKRLSRMIRHLVQYVTDIWEESLKHPRDDPAMVLRLRVEYDAFFVRAMHYLYSSQRLGAWQFLAVVPYNLISAETLWGIFCFLHGSDEFDECTLRVQFEERLTLLAEDELYYLLNTFANMALARAEHDMDFIQAATKDLLIIGFISKMTQERCSRTARTLLAHITSKHPRLLSMILSFIVGNLDSVGTLSLYLYEELPLTIWGVTDDDLYIISGLLTTDTVLGRMILSRLNWDIIPYEMHCQVALLALKLAQQDATCMQWAWQMSFRLKLHVSDGHFTNLKQVLDPEHYNLMQAVQAGHALGTFIAVVMTSWGHLVPLICSQGLPKLLYLQSYQHHEAVLFALYLIIPLFIDSQEYIINNENFQEIITNLINADRGYISMAKSLISMQSTVLQAFGNMIQSQIANYESYGLETPRCLVRLWFNALISIPGWNRDLGVLYLLDVIIKATFFHQDALDAITSVLKELVRNNTEQSGGLTSLFKWGSTAVSLIPGALASTTYLAYILIDLEFVEKELKTGLWRALLLQLHAQKGKVNVDAALKKAAGVAKLSLPTGLLGVYRWAQQAIDTGFDHPILPVLWQKFFALFLYRLEGLSSERGCVGDKFFEGVINFAFFKRVKRRLLDCLEYYRVSLGKAPDDGYLQGLVALFQAYVAWLEEPVLQKANLLLPSLPALYLPNLLAVIVQGTSTAWHEYLNYNVIKAEQAEAIRVWQTSNFRHKSNVNRPLPNPGKVMESEDPIERILRRLKIYEAPKPPPELIIADPVIPITGVFDTKETLLKSLEPTFKVFKQFAHNHTLKVSEHKALDCSYQELVPQLYRSILNKVTISEPCKGRNDTVHCSGAAVITLEMQEARVNERIQLQIGTNRTAYESLLSQSLQAPSSTLCMSSVALQQVIKILQNQLRYNPASSELGIELFYYILGLVNDESTSYLPTKTLYASCLEKLGASHICGVEFEMPRLLEKILKEPRLGGHLAPHFFPTNVGTTNLLYMYGRINAEIGKDYDVAFTLLSKFEIEKWLRLKVPNAKQRSEFIHCVVKALTDLGFDPAIESLSLHGLYRRHLLNIFEYQFPEHYGEVLVVLLRSSNGTSEANLLALSVWLDILNYLAHPVEINPKVSLREQFRRYAQHQKLLNHQELLETAELFGKHFTQERFQYGLYGLYPKCRHYIDILTVLLGMIGHGLIFSMLNTHQGDLSDKLSHLIWPHLINVFTPWLVPYSMQNMKENMASWIQQLADDRSVLLPWIPSDIPLAQKIIAVFCECIHFLIYTLPGCTNILSFIWQWYFTSFAHPAVKEHILSTIHHSFLGFPWESFWPSLIDLDLMVMLMDKYLPECHLFLSHIFMAVPWQNWISSFKTSPPHLKTRIYQCFLSLLVKVPNEPTVRGKYLEKVRALLVDAEEYEWGVIESGLLQNIMDWYVLSCDPSVIVRTDPLDIDFRVLHFLKIVSGYDKPLEDPAPGCTQKRLIFVKSHVKLLSVYINKHKAAISKKESEIKTVIVTLLSTLEATARHQTEFNLLLKEVLQVLNIEIVQEFAVKCCLEWISGQNSDSLPIRGLFEVAPSVVRDNGTLGDLLEASLSSYFHNSVNGALTPTWGEVITVLKLKPTKELEQCLVQQSQILALNALFLHRIDTCGDVESLLTVSINWLANLKITSEEIEAKVPLLWFGILHLTLSYCDKDEVVTSTLLHRFSKALQQLSEVKAPQKWGRGLLNVIGINKSTSASLNFRFLSRSMAGYVLAQLPDMKGEPQVVRRTAFAPFRVGQTGGNSECSKILLNLDFGQSQGKIKECEEMVLKKVQDAENSLHNAGKFLELLVKQFYIKPYYKDVS